jgi:predicted nuclease of predicted toxin-antitoxin system
MNRFLANENVPGDAVAAARSAGLQLAWIGEIAPGASDEDVLARAQAEQCVLVTFDKDFGELAFRRGLSAARGVILLRPRLRSPGFLAAFLVKVLQQPINWEGHFAVANEAEVRVVALPGPSPKT